MTTASVTPPGSQGIESVMRAGETLPPPAEFAARAAVRSLAAYEELWQRASADPERFWGEVAAELAWARPWTRVREGELPHVRWFVGGGLNATVSCLDRHLATWRRNKAALIWEGEPGDSRTLTYHELHREVCKAANALRELGVAKGDRVGIYLPMIPELAVSVLACARIGATHSVVFGGFSAEALADRMNDAGAVCVITADGGWRRGKPLPLKEAVDRALAKVPSVKSVLVVARLGGTVAMREGRDHFWSDFVDRQPGECAPEIVDPEHPLFILYTSGTTGKPKGVVHSTGGYLAQVAWSMRMVFDLRDDDTYWCTADLGWVTGHSYVLYGPLANGATTLMYEGAPDAPQPDRFWRLIDRWGVTIFYTAPTAIRAFMRWGDEWPRRHSLSSLRLLGTVGEPINPAAWSWYRSEIGHQRCPIVDTWWQTETGAILISPLPGATPTKPGSCTRPLPGIEPAVVKRDGTPCGPNEGGYLVVREAWPAMLRTVWGDPARFERGYFGEISVDGKPLYFTGDGARRDEDGYFWVMGRVDDVVNVAGHRLGTAEVESALVSHPFVAEAAVVGRPDEIKGQGIVAFVTLRSGRAATATTQAELAAHVVQEIGAIARPDEIRFTDALPKTRSGKIMRRLLKEVAAKGHATGDVTTLEDMSVLERLSNPSGEE